jgi:hypothetical protein
MELCCRWWTADAPHSEVLLSVSCCLQPQAEKVLVELHSSTEHVYGTSHPISKVARSALTRLRDHYQTVVREHCLLGQAVGLSDARTTQQCAGSLDLSASVTVTEILLPRSLLRPLTAHDCYLVL